MVVIDTPSSCASLISLSVANVSLSVADVSLPDADVSLPDETRTSMKTRSTTGLVMAILSKWEWERYEYKTSKANATKNPGGWPAAALDARVESIRRGDPRGTRVDQSRPVAYPAVRVCTMKGFLWRSNSES